MIILGSVYAFKYIIQTTQSIQERSLLEPKVLHSLLQLILALEVHLPLVVEAVVFLTSRHIQLTECLWGRQREALVHLVALAPQPQTRPWVLQSLLQRILFVIVFKVSVILEGQVPFFKPRRQGQLIRHLVTIESLHIEQARVPSVV